MVDLVCVNYLFDFGLSVRVRLFYCGFIICGWIADGLVDLVALRVLF